MPSKEIPRWFSVLGYGVCAINSLLLLLVAVDYLVCEFDLFLIIWMSSILLLVTVPLGVICFIYSLFHLRHRVGRCVAIWSLALLLFLFVVFYLLPSGSSRVPAKMEQHCFKYESTMLSVANQLYDLMPDSTMLEYTQEGEVTLHSIDSLNNILGYPFVADTDTYDASANSQFSTVRQLSAEGKSQDLHYAETKNRLEEIFNSQLINSLHCKKLTVYKPTGLATFHYLTRGFATYWFEVSLTPFTSEQVQQQLDTYNTIPFSSHVCFRFHGGATDGDAPFPYKEKYVKLLYQRGLLTDTISFCR